MNLGELQQKAKAQIEKDKTQLEQTMNQHLKDLEMRLKESTQAVVNTIENDMQTISKRTNLFTKASHKIFLFNLISSFCLIIGIVITSLIVSSFLDRLILKRIEEVSILNLTIKEKSSKLTQLEKNIFQQEYHLKTIQTLGMEIIQEKKLNGTMESVIILPHGMKAETGWQLRGKEAIKLIKE